MASDAALSQAGAIVYGTGRGIANAQLDTRVHRAVCDHRDDASVARVFERITHEQGRLDLLVNNAWGGYERMVEDGRFTRA